MKYVGDSISAALFFRPVKISTPANFVGNADFNSVLASCRAQISATAGVHTDGLTAGDYLANPVISNPALCGQSSRKSSPLEIHADKHPEVSGHSKIKAADFDAVCKKTDLEPAKKPIAGNRPGARSSQSTPACTFNNDPIERSIDKAAEKYDLPQALIKAVIKAESNFDANAVSSAGAQGLMQLMPATAQELGVKNSFDIDQNIDGGSRYLRKMLDKFGGNTKLALAAYNAGPGAVEKFEGNVPYAETRNYIKRVMRFSARYA